MLSLGQRLRERYRIDALPDPESGLIVYRGYDTVDNRVCAIKEFEGEQAARLEREAEALTLHRHPNLPVAYEAFMEEGKLYVVFEWPEGESLQNRLKREGRLPEADASWYISQILSALDYVHTLNLPIARGGFAPAHIWIAPDGRPRLYSGVIAITNAAPFVAPEGGTDPRSALYSAGATLYNILTNRSPEGSASPRKYNPTLSLGLTQAVSRSLSSRPEARFATIRDMRKALGRAKANEVEPPPKPARAPFKLPWVPVLSGIGVVIMLGLGFMVVRNNGTSAAPPSGTSTSSAVTVTPAPTASPAATAASTEPPATVPAATLAATDTQAVAFTPTIAPSATIEASPTASGTLVAGATQTSANDRMVLVYVPAGSFLMGSPDTDTLARGNEKPQHTETVAAFWIDQTEVTNAQYGACLAAKACTAPQSFDSITRSDYFHDPQYANYPVVWVNWLQAQKYCTWAGRRLPSESEWEKAARGPDGPLYPWGNEAPDNTLLNFNSAAKDTTAVGSFPNGASPYGALDMVGNVVEWVDGFYYDSYFTIVANKITPTPSFHGGVRILRSSSWADVPADIRAAARRYALAQGNAFYDVGFRCAMTP